MNIKNTIKKYTADLTNVQFMKLKVAGQRGQVTKLRKEVHRVQHLVKESMLALTDAVSGFSSNAYPSYESAVAEINRKYKGTAD